MTSNKFISIIGLQNGSKGSILKSVPDRGIGTPPMRHPRFAPDIVKYVSLLF